MRENRRTYVRAYRYEVACVSTNVRVYMLYRSEYEYVQSYVRMLPYVCMYNRTYVCLMMYMCVFVTAYYATILLQTYFILLDSLTPSQTFLLCVLSFKIHS